MKKCKGECGEMRNVWQFYTGSSGKTVGVCKFCITARQRVHYHHVKKANERKREARIQQQMKRDKDALAGKRPCAIFQGYLFSGDVA